MRKVTSAVSLVPVRAWSGMSSSSALLLGAWRGRQFRQLAGGAAKWQLHLWHTDFSFCTANHNHPLTSAAYKYCSPV